MQLDFLKSVSLEHAYRERPMIGRLALIVGRVAIAALFLHESWFKITHYAGSITYMERFGVTPLLLPGALAIEIGGGLALLTGFGLRYAALLLAGFSAAAAVLFHWNWADQNQLLHFEKDIAIAGGLLILACLDFQNAAQD